MGDREGCGCAKYHRGALLDAIVANTSRKGTQRFMAESPVRRSVLLGGGSRDVNPIVGADEIHKR
jgi:hypothetical protein